jgi:hypothetical protein
MSDLDKLKSMGSKQERVLLKPIEREIEEIVLSLSEGTIGVLVGEHGGDWEIAEYEAMISASLQNSPRDPETLSKMLDLMKQIQAAELGDAPDKDEMIRRLGAEFDAL